ncbi:hypothetical protein JWJ90_03265 [Desulfobulbus rhabdoformis]|uniref:hypothetical protein n=1 Tax=Desulfobulbus rhabdoformis TaxID=34032 RepID=UPI00196357BC|nr:hypothetical protein [Desulfobulbus rhabdoformis]MBM9613301.1 hypothetical protein [Desulfobulbus rhabdoformis]
MVRTVRSKRKKRRWFFPVLAILLTAAGAILFRCPHSLQDIGRIVQSAVGKITSFSAGPEPAEPVLRGTIYDSNLRELAVSYKLYSLFANPVEMADRGQIAKALAPLVGLDAAELQARLQATPYSTMLATNLDEEQAKAVESLHLSGITCKADTVRFYPGHTVASHVLGFMGEGVGLSGIEGKYDSVLQGVFRKGNIPDIDFQGQDHLGENGADLVLTLDVDLQKMLESRFREYLSASGTEKGMGLVIEPKTGRILALMNQPSFDPNYFWKANESNRVNRIYNHQLERDLIRPIVARAAAIERQGLDGTKVLPPTVAAPDYGFSGKELEAFEQQIELNGAVVGNWTLEGAKEQNQAKASEVTGVQVGVTLASLANGGWRITPYVVDSVYDHATTSRYGRSPDATDKLYVLAPALGIQIRRELFSTWKRQKKNGVIFTGKELQIHPEGQFSEYSMQNLFVALTPAEQPRYLLLIATEKDHLLPDPAGQRRRRISLEKLGRGLLADIVQREEAPLVAQAPPLKSPENLRQFFISKRLSLKTTLHKEVTPVGVMPQMHGMSLRKGLQQIDKLKLKVRINGSGRIVAQYPLAGQPLLGIKECVVTLESR